MYIDRIDLSIPQEDLQSVLEAFASAASTLELLPSVGPIDRKRYAKLGLKNEALTRQIIEVGRASRHLIPAGIDFEKIDRDLVAREQLRTLKVILQGLLDRVSDSMLLTGVDLYAAALSMYHCLRRNADTASLKSTVAELKKGFARPSRKKKEEEPPAAPVPAVAHTTLRLERSGSSPAYQCRDAAVTLPVPAANPPSSREAAKPLNTAAEGLAPSAYHVPVQISPLMPMILRTDDSGSSSRYGLPVLFSGDFVRTSPGTMCQGNIATMPLWTGACRP